MKTEIRVDGPLDMLRTLERYRVWGEDPVNRLVDGAFLRAIRVADRWRGYELRWTGHVDAERLLVSTPGDRSTRVLEAAVDEVGRICGLGLDVEAFYTIAKEDPVLGPLVPRLWGLRPTLSPQPFEMLIGSVCAQQISLPFAFTVKARLVRRFGTRVDVAGQTVYGFPDAERLAHARVGDLRRLQLTTRKSEYIIGLARHVVSGALDLRSLRGTPNERVIEALTAVRGFGRWTAEWFLARHLGRGDVCAAGDLAVRRAFERFYNRGRALDEAGVRRRAATWGAHQNMAVHYLLAGQRLSAEAA
jgi:3-methyladenine DNA glycosylase/8-oxoguanine DNA glycosylase